jgi:hypothetical protein
MTRFEPVLVIAATLALAGLESDASDISDGMNFQFPIGKATE